MNHKLTVTCVRIFVVQKLCTMTLYNNIFEKFNQTYISSATLALLAQSCLGGAAAMTILANGTSLWQMAQLGVIVLLCMGVNTGILAQLGHKMIFNFVLASAFFSTLFIILNSN